METGGNAPFVLFDDADLDHAVAEAMVAKFRNSGQTCTCARHLILQSGLHDRFVGRGGAVATGGPFLQPTVLTGVPAGADASDRSMMLKLSP